MPTSRSQPSHPESSSPRPATTVGAGTLLVLAGVRLDAPRPGSSIEQIPLPAGASRIIDITVQ